MQPPPRVDGPSRIPLSSRRTNEEDGLSGPELSRPSGQAGPRRDELIKLLASNERVPRLKIQALATLLTGLANYPTKSITLTADHLKPVFRQWRNAGSLNNLMWTLQHYFDEKGILKDLAGRLRMVIGLERLDLAGGNTDAETVAKLLIACPQLRILDVRYTTDDAIPAAVARHGAGLVALGLGHCKYVTDAHLRRIAIGCPRLQRLDLAFCQKITHAGFNPLIARLSAKLTYIDLTSCKNIGFGMLTHCIQLTYLNLSKCPNFPLGLTTDIVRACPQLRQLNLYWCELDRKALVQYRQECK